MPSVVCAICNYKQSVVDQFVYDIGTCSGVPCLFQEDLMMNIPTNDDNDDDVKTKLFFD